MDRNRERRSDGQRIVTVSRDWTAKLWEASSGRELLTFKGHTQNVDSVAFSPDGLQIATAGGDGTFMWRAASPGQVAAWQKQDKAAAERVAVLKRERVEAEERDRTVRQVDEGSIKQWLMLGPIELSEDQTGEEALDEEQIIPEHLLKPKPGDRQPIGEREFVWRPFQLQDSTFDFTDDEIFGRGVGQAIAYAVCYIHSDHSQRGLRMRVGGRQAKVYLNGQQVHKTVDARGDHTVAVGLQLNGGLNVLVFKSVNKGGSWKGSVRLTDKAGNPVPGIKVASGSSRE